MAYYVAIRKNETGQVRTIHQDFDWDDGSYYWWTAGNMGCDCNKELEFESINNPNFSEQRCSNDRFTVLYADLEDGTRIIFDPEDCY